MRYKPINFSLSSKKSSGTFHPIPVTFNEEEKYSTEQSMTKKELLNIIQTLVGSSNEQVRHLHNGDEMEETEETVETEERI
nr:6025_t:CDS:2 [Entrophospora candida]